MLIKFLRRYVVLCIMLVLPPATKILDVKGTSADDVGHCAIRMEKMVNMPAEFSGEIVHRTAGDSTQYRHRGGESNLR
jgi:hypothetical protein